MFPPPQNCWFQLPPFKLHRNPTSLFFTSTFSWKKITSQTKLPPGYYLISSVKVDHKMFQAVYFLHYSWISQVYNNTVVLVNKRYSWQTICSSRQRTEEIFWTHKKVAEFWIVEFCFLFTVLTLCIICISNEGVPRPALSVCDQRTNLRGTAADSERMKNNVWSHIQTGRCI